MAATLVGPVEGGARGCAFLSPRFDVDAAGYVQEEFFLSGTARAYRIASDDESDGDISLDGRWRLESGREAPFTTRILVVRPADRHRFNGTVILNWQNVTAGFETGTAPAHIVDEGFAWVGVSAQRASITGLPRNGSSGMRGWDPERYGALVHRGDDFSFDIYSAAARSVGPRRPTSDVDPMGGLAVARVLGTGTSQSATRLRTYGNGMQPIDGLLDGLLLLLDFGICVHPNSRAVLHSGERKHIAPVRTVRIRDDLGIPVMVVNSETEAISTFHARQPDTDHFRLWEVAGTAHAGADGADEMRGQPDGTDGAERADAKGGRWPEDRNVLSHAPVRRAALHHMHRWLATRTPPPSQPRIEFEEGYPPVIRRDECGNAVGGIRLPDMAVPTGVHNGTRDGDDLAAFMGRSTPFDLEELRRRYPTVQAYLEAYDDATDAAVASGVILPDAAADLRANAAKWAADVICW